jgi:hypothetical protein
MGGRRGVNATERTHALENLRIEVARWANERRGIRQSDLLEIYEARIMKALDRFGEWREKP